MNAGQHWGVWVGHGDAPKIAKAEAIGFGLGGGGIVKFVAVVAQVIEKVSIIGTAVFLEECRACLWHIDSAHSLLIGQAITGRSVVGTEPSIGLQRRAIDMEGKHICPHRPRFLIAGIPMDAVEDRIEIMLTQQPLVFQQDRHRLLPRFAERQALQTVLIENRDPLPCTKLRHDLAKIARQRARPTERIHLGDKRRADQLLKAGHDFDSRLIGRRKRKHKMRLERESHAREGWISAKDFQ